MHCSKEFYCPSTEHSLSEAQLCSMPGRRTRCTAPPPPATAASPGWLPGPAGQSRGRQLRTRCSALASVLKMAEGCRKSTACQRTERCVKVRRSLSAWVPDGVQLLRQEAGTELE